MLIWKANTSHVFSPLQSISSDKIQDFQVFSALPPVRLIPLVLGMIAAL
jgi:hypothetical protein